MLTAHTSESLRAFADEIAEAYNAGLIHAPAHLEAGNEKDLIRIFKNIQEEDWICGQWRMMSKALLKGVPVEELRASVMAGKSIALCFPEYRVISSAIVGGIVPIALGIAMALAREPARWIVRRRGGARVIVQAETWEEAVKFVSDYDGPDPLEGVPPGIVGARKYTPRVWVFVGDMTAMTGVYQECRRYAVGHDLPISFVVEDNGKSVVTDTRSVWGSTVRATGTGKEARDIAIKDGLETRFTYSSPWPHAGAGRRIEF